MMNRIRLKNTLCLALILSWVGGWPSITPCGAEESQEPVSERTLWASQELPPEEKPEGIPSATQVETKHPQNSKTKELLKDVGQVALSITAVPVFAAAQTLMFGAVVVYGTVYGTYYCCKEVWKRAKERLAPGQDKGGSHEDN